MKWKALALGLALALPAHAESTEKATTQTGAALLDKVISHPGSYAQVCDVMTSPFDIPYHAYRINGYSGASFSKANVSAIEDNRDSLVKAIRARLLEIDFSKKPQQPSDDPSPEENMDGEAYGNDPKSLNPLLLEIILNLDAVEALPELLVVEQKLVDGIAKAKENIKVAPPLVNGWYVAQENLEYKEDEPEAKRERRFNLFQSRIAQRDVVMVMAVLMREKKFEPYLKTSLEAEYAKGLKKQAKEFNFPEVTDPSKAPEEIEGWKVEYDPIAKVLKREYSPVLIPYTRESRDQIRAAASKWILEH